MIDAGNALQKAYYDRLQNISINSRIVPVYDSAGLPKDVVYPYIVLSTMTMTEGGAEDKEIYGLEATMLVQIFDEYESNYGQKKVSSEIANEVIKRIRKRTPGQIDMGEDWYVILTRLSSSDTFEVFNGQKIQLQRLLRFYHEIDQTINNDQ